MQRHRVILPDQGSRKQSQETPPQDPSRQRKRFQVNVACNYCRIRKHKCSGERPRCAACQDRDLDCVYEADPDSTRAITLKRTHAALETEAQGLRQLVELLRNRPRAYVETVLRSLRDGDGVDAAISTAEAAIQTPRTIDRDSSTQWNAFVAGRDTLRDWVRSDLKSLYPTISQTNAATPSLAASTPRPSLPINNRMSIDNLLTGRTPKAKSEGAETTPGLLSTGALPSSMSELRPLSDDRLALIQPTQWTRVPIMKIEMANMLSIYLSWLHSAFRFFDEESFIQDLVSNEKNYCSDLLVNSILSLVAIKLGDHDRKRLRILRQAFIEEANTHWKHSIQQVSVTIVSSACVLSMSNYLHSSEGLSMDILQHGFYVAGRLGMFSTNSTSIPEDPILLKAYRAKSIAAWGYYSICAISTLHVPDGPACSRYPSLPTFANDIIDVDKWQPWPRTLSAKPVGPIAASRYGAFCSLAKLINDYASLRQQVINARFANRDKNDVVSLQLATILLQHLKEWNESLHPQLRCHASARPCVLEMHITVHTIIMECFRPFTGRDKASSQIYTSSLKQVTEIIQHAYQNWGNLPNLTTSVGIFHNVAFSLLPFLGKAREADDSFLLIIRIMYHMSLTNPVVVDLMKYVLTAAVDRGAALPAEAMEIMQKLQDDNDQSDEDERVDTSTFSFITDLEMLHHDLEAASLRSSLKKNK